MIKTEMQQLTTTNNDMQDSTIEMQFQNDIDYILVNDITEQYFANEIQVFERNLVQKGLDLKVIDIADNKRFVRIHAPKETLLKFCEIMKLRMPLKNATHRKANLTEQFSRNKSYLFNVDSEYFIPPSIKYMIINFILERETFTEEDETGNSDDENENFGITKLILNGAYLAAYPLHDEEIRNHLENNWANPKKYLTFQPLDEIKDYFGIKDALYYAWLEFYLIMLAIASAIVVLYYIIIIFITMFSSVNIDECNAKKNYAMCPQCDKDCDIWHQKEDCSALTLKHILENNGNIFFSILMSLWVAIYLNMWNQHSAKIMNKWGINNDYFLDNDLPTAQYLKKTKVFQQFCKRFSPIMISFTVVLFWLCVVLAVLVGLMFYRVSLSASEFIFGDDSKSLKNTVVTVTGGIFDLISILILNEVYNRIAEKLTEKELHRTQKQAEDSLMWKLYIFWFINYYSSFFYVAFFRGKLIGTPARYNRVLGYRQEECGSEGCIVDLFIQLAVVMIGDMTYNNIIEYLIPYLRKKYRSYRVDSQLEREENENSISTKQWIQDFKLLHWGSKETSMEYLEMVLQFGLITLFVSAFPFAPIFALINNIFEIRFDARNLLTNFRRPVARNVKNIGIWVPIMDLLVQLSVITNACIIAFTTNIIPRLVYRYYRSERSFFVFTHSRFNTSDFDPLTMSKMSRLDFKVCWYPDYRNPPDHVHKYELSEFYWHILAFRLLFVLCFMVFVHLLKMVVKFFIPPKPKWLKTKIVNNMNQIQRIIIMHESRQIQN